MYRTLKFPPYINHLVCLHPHLSNVDYPSMKQSDVSKTKLHIEKEGFSSGGFSDIRHGGNYEWKQLVHSKRQHTVLVNLFFFSNIECCQGRRFFWCTLTIVHNVFPLFTLRTTTWTFPTADTMNTPVSGPLFVFKSRTKETINAYEVTKHNYFSKGQPCSSRQAVHAQWLAEVFIMYNVAGSFFFFFSA